MMKILLFYPTSFCQGATITSTLRSKYTVVKTNVYFDYEAHEDIMIVYVQHLTFICQNQTLSFWK